MEPIKRPTRADNLRVIAALYLPFAFLGIAIAALGAFLGAFLGVAR